MMALVDTLDYFPEGQPGRQALMAALEKDAAAIVRVQDAQSGLWYEVLDKGSANGNYLESSGSCMFVYALARGVERGYLAGTLLANAERGYSGILKHFIRRGPVTMCR